VVRTAIAVVLHDVCASDTRPSRRSATVDGGSITMHARASLAELLLWVVSVACIGGAIALSF
jgi:hypothetical protein